MYAHNFTSDPEEILNQYTVLIIPKTVIGDNARVLLKMHHEFYAEGELIEVLNSKSKGSRRNDRLIVCEKFNECNGCQLQMLSYEDQLKYKQSVIQRAYKYFILRFSTCSKKWIILVLLMNHLYNTLIEQN